MENRPFITWRAPSYPDHERSRLWYLIMGTFVGAMIIYGIQSKSWGLAVLMAMSAIVYYIFIIRRSPDIRDISILEEGIQFDHEFFPWNSIKGFWFQKYTEYTQLHLEHVGDWRPDTVIQTGSVSAVHIRKVLSKYLPEHSDNTERILDFISRICKI